MDKPGTTDYKQDRNSELYDRLSIFVPKGQRQAVKAFANFRGNTVNGLVNDLLREAMGISESKWKGEKEEDG